MRINIPPATRVLIVLTLSFTLLYTVARWQARLSDGTVDHAEPPSFVPFLTLVPSRIIFYPWTILTSTFIEQDILSLLINLTAFYFSGRYLERAWGAKDFSFVVLVGVVVPNLLIIPTYLAWGAIMRNTIRADTPITGAITLQAAFLVAFKQLVPEHTVSLYKGLIKMRVKHFPAIFLLLNTISGVALGTDTALLLGWYGLVSTWVYLQFFKYQADLGTITGTTRIRGDASETFAFATFFPHVVQPPISAVCDQLYLFFCRLGVIQPFSDEAIASSNEQAAARGEASLPTIAAHARGAKAMSKREEAERRRALALRALDQRLQPSEGQSSVAVAPGEVTTLQ